MDWIEDLYWSVQPKVYWSLGSLFIFMTLADHLMFAFHPLEKNIFLDQDVFQQESKLQKAISKAKGSLMQ